MTTTTAPPEPVSAAPVGREGFGTLLHAEWTKLRTVPGWVAGLVVAGLVTVLLGLLGAAGGGANCGGGPADDVDQVTAEGSGTPCGPGDPPLGPHGEAVSDRFTFVRQPMTGDGSITVRVTSLAGREPADLGTEPWAKAGVMVKQGTSQGSTYAAVMATGAHGVRMQHDYVNDVAGPAGAVSETSPRWLRLVRTGDTLTGYASTDGARWTEVGTARLEGLDDTAEVGLFVASPDHEETTLGFASTSMVGLSTLATATFDGVTLGGGWSGDAWRGTDVGPDQPAAAAPPGSAPERVENVERSGDRFTVTGGGDVAPKVGGGPESGVEQSLVGVFAGLVAAIIVGVLFITSEYRRGLVRTTFTATPRRGRVLLAKATVLGVTTFAIGLVASGLAVWLVGALRRSDGGVILPAPALTEARVVVGTAALLALAAVLAVAIGAVLRRGGGAVALVTGLVVLPYLLAVASAVPLDAARWLLRVTPAAGFAVQQSVPEYAHVLGNYTPPGGYYPLPWWAGFGVLVLWTAAALALAVVLVRRRDA